ncbi:tautomerase family protein [uncultured Lacticaseibacillus sp.]|uniref:tautomerase family protein n=1 Tax=uncultured Lacticaseibacillus sp. TaxID=2775882 RepID=UPI00259430CC|nr:tautomerase family protein [uncultured Lacticaseibacillus sp.]
MPLMKIDMLKGHTEKKIRDILDISYHVMMDDFDAPEGDRYQVVAQHEPYEMHVLDTGLGIRLIKNVLIFGLTTRPRTTEQKQGVYTQLVNALHEKLGIAPSDVVINLTVNSDEDWSFGYGKAQFLTGDL